MSRKRGLGWKPGQVAVVWWQEGEGGTCGGGVGLKGCLLLAFGVPRGNAAGRGGAAGEAESRYRGAGGGGGHVRYLGHQAARRGA